MEFLETSVFTRQVKEILTDDEYAKLQYSLAENPGHGDVMPGGGGLRKLRWQSSGRGKRGGARIIYYWKVSDHVVLMLFAYPKNEQDNLTKDQLKQLRQVVERAFGGLNE